MTNRDSLIDLFNAEVNRQEQSSEPNDLEKHIAELCQEALLDIDVEILAPPVALFIQEQPACTLGNFSASIGKPKGRKTFNVSAMVAAALTGGKVLEYQGNLPEGKRRVIYFDTEQSRYHAYNVLRRVARMSGLTNAEVKQQMEFFALRPYAVEMRIAMMEYVISHSEGIGLVVIDGIRDMVCDINNPRESTEVVSHLMRWTDKYDLHLHVVIHQNKGDDNARGHIGTEINNKSETVIKVEIDRTNEMVSTVEAVYTRDKPFEKFAFEINNQGFPSLLEGYQPPSEEKGAGAWSPYSDIPESVHRQALRMAFPTDDTLLKRGEMEARLPECYAESGNIELNNYRVKRLVQMLINKRMIEQVDGELKKGNPFRFLPDFHY